MGGRNKNKYRVKYFAYCGCGARGPVATARGEGFNPLSEADHKKAFWKAANLWNSRKEL